MWPELAIILGLYAVGGILFTEFARDVPWQRRLVKLALTVGFTVAVSAIVGRPWSLLWFLIPIVGICFIHGIWLPKHGINGLTGEPRDKYNALRATKPRLR